MSAADRPIEKVRPLCGSSSAGILACFLMYGVSNDDDEEWEDLPSHLPQIALYLGTCKGVVVLETLERFRIPCVDGVIIFSGELETLCICPARNMMLKRKMNLWKSQEGVGVIRKNIPKCRQTPYK
jgi:hypothetical protein